MMRYLVLLAFTACTHAAAPSVRTWDQRFVEHDGVRIEYRMRPGRGIPVVLVPGMSNSAKDYVDNVALVDALGDRTLIAISIRGRGQSSSPEVGWTVAAQASDIAAVVDREHLARYHLVGHSMGVGYALYHALAHRDAVASFTAADYAPGLAALAEEFVQFIEGRPERPGFDRHIARRMFVEQPGEYAPNFAGFTVPTLAILSTEGSAPSVEDMWKTGMPTARVVWIEHDHDTFTSAAGRALLVEQLERAR